MSAIPVPGARAGFLQDQIAAFADSDIVFQRGTSQVPFPPLGFVNARYYGDSEVDNPISGKSESFDQWTLSQFAMLPVLVSQRDAVVVGEWVSWSRFDARSDFESFDVLSVSMPVGWLRQANPSWQIAAFAAPLGHKASLAGASWAWEYMGGSFGRYIQSDRLWWAFGFFVNIQPGDDLYLPYAGASWSINDSWTLSAVMPWPGLLYAPRSGLLFRLGVAPSGTSWEFRPGNDEVSVDLATWDFGLSAESRFHGNFWARVEIGIGGMRGLSLRQGDWESPDTSADSSPYISIGVNYRPALLQ